jgi:RNA polymerase sporulation-specific sigma factor
MRSHIIAAYCRDYELKNGREPTVSEISNALSLNGEEIVFALDSLKPLLSLYEKNEEGGELENLLGEDTMEDAFDSIAVRDALNTLSSEEKKLIGLRYYRGLTQEQTARILGLSQVKVSREEKKICDKLRKLLTG